MLELAVRWGQEPATLKSLAQSQDIPEKYLWHILHPLAVAGLVKATRGSSGGYSLAKPPGEITVKDILAPLEGPPFSLECLANKEACKKSEACAAREMWGELGRRIAHAMESITLQDMMEQHSAKQNQAFSFSI